jgi:hypothetical protein
LAEAASGDRAGGPIEALEEVPVKVEVDVNKSTNFLMTPKGGRHESDKLL